jgi:hypothetical protein
MLTFILELRPNSAKTVGRHLNPHVVVRVVAGNAQIQIVCTVRAKGAGGQRAPVLALPKECIALGLSRGTHPRPNGVRLSCGALKKNDSSL